MDADKIKKKLNGSILKGTKVRIEKARPEKELPVEDGKPERPKKQKDLSKKRKRDETIPAVDIGERNVKRGWTTPPATGKSKGKSQDKDKEKKNVKSKYTTGAECLFKTVLPPNVAANTKLDGKVDKRKRKAGKEAVVHEFSKTTKYATFLRGNAVSGSPKGVAEYVEGKGWVGEDGNVVEVVKKSKQVTEPEVDSKAPIAEDDSTSEDSSDESSSEREEIPALLTSASAPVPKPTEGDSETSTSGSSSEESDSESSGLSEEDSSDEVSSKPSEEQVDSRPASRPQSSSGPPMNLSIKIPPIATPTSIPAVHPLEALYKKPKGGTEVAAKSEVPTFSFFGADEEADEELDEFPNQPPMTPFTQRDFEYRGIRSAAPTPDTAYANKRFVWPTDKSENEDEDEDDAAEEPSSPIRKSSTPGESSKKEDAAAPDSDFKKWFYEHRGETTRAWKKRRRVAAKEKRHRENKRREQRAI